MAFCIRTVLNDPSRKKEMEMRTLAVGQTMAWANVADIYAELCTYILDDRGTEGRI